MEQIGQNPEAVVGGVVFLGILGLIAVMLIVSVVVAYLLMTCFQRIPQEHRLMEPGMVWLLMIPCFNLIWNFVVFPKLSRSYKSYFNAAGDESEGNCGETLGLAYSISVVCTLVPVINGIAGLVALVLLIMYLVKVMELKNKILASDGN